MVDRSIKKLIGVLYDILVKVDKFIFLMHYVILDCQIDFEVPIILGRPFLTIKRVLVDVESGELKFWVNDEEVTFNVCILMKLPSELQVVSVIDVMDEAVASTEEGVFVGESLTTILLNYDGEDIEYYDEVVAALTGLGMIQGI